MASRAANGIKDSTFLSDTTIYTLRKIEKEQRAFVDLVRKQKNFSAAEKEAIKITTVDEFSRFWKTINQTHNDFNERHDRGFRLWSRRYQKSAVGVESFMHDFSTLIKIVQNIAWPSGAIALGVVSTFFTVASRKNKIEEEMASTLMAIEKRLLGMRNYETIYDDSHELNRKMQEKLVDAYMAFLLFCIAATKYCKRRSISRWVKAMDISSDVTEAAKQAQDSLSDIRLLNEELLGLNLALTKRKCDELQSHLDHVRLRELQHILNLQMFSEEARENELKQHHEAISSEDQFNLELFQQMNGTDLDSFKKSATYQAWIESKHSCFLSLLGYNNVAIETEHCWLSPVATTTIFDLKNSDKDIYYAYLLFPWKGEVLFDAFPKIFLQLLRQKSSAFIKARQHDELLAELSHYQEHGKHCGSRLESIEEKKINILHEVGKRVIGFFDEFETVYVIIDRADWCRNWKNHDHRKALYEGLVKMTRAARCKLRILAIADGHAWKAGEYRDEYCKGMGGQVIVRTMDQEDQI